MDSSYARVCRDGHLIEQAYHSSSARIGDSISGDSYCEECGSKTIDSCASCNTFIRIDYLSTTSGKKIELPTYCRSCGDAFPWSSTIEEKKAREGKFLNLDEPEIGGQFYPSLINEINLCYQIKANEATKVLYRKLLECLLIDILRGYYGMEEAELFYDTERRRSRAFGELLNNFKECEADLGKFSNKMDEELYRAIGEFKYDGDASAHAIEPNISDSTIEEKTERATVVAKILFDLREKVFTAG